MASKSKRRGRVFRASCILAALIIAGSSFAWFTSKDEVTNRLSASADYDVAIIENFAPPKQWVPGETVKKEEAVTNTGSVDAFVKQQITGDLEVTVEIPVSTAPTATANTGYIALKPAEYGAIEAGSYLAWKPEGSANKIGKQVVYAINNSDDNDKNDVTDFTPDTTGLYIFRRAITTAERKETSGDKNSYLDEKSFEYVGYYFVKNVDTGKTDSNSNPILEDRYYKLNRIVNNTLELADLDGNLASAPTVMYAKEATEAIKKVPMAFDADATNYGTDAYDPKLVVTYQTNRSSDLSGMANADADAYKAYDIYLDYLTGKTKWDDTQSTSAADAIYAKDTSNNPLKFKAGDLSNQTGLINYDQYVDGTLTDANDARTPQADLSNWSLDRLNDRATETQAELDAASPNGAYTKENWDATYNAAAKDRATVNKGVKSKARLDKLMTELQGVVGNGATNGIKQSDHIADGFHYTSDLYQVNGDGTVTVFAPDVTLDNSTAFLTGDQVDGTIRRLTLDNMNDDSANSLTNPSDGNGKFNESKITSGADKKFGDADGTTSDAVFSDVTKYFGAKFDYANAGQGAGGVDTLREAWDEYVTATKKQKLIDAKIDIVERAITAVTTSNTDVGRSLEELQEMLTKLKSEKRVIDDNLKTKKAAYEKYVLGDPANNLRGVKDYIDQLNKYQDDINAANAVDYNKTSPFAALTGVYVGDGVTDTTYPGNADTANGGTVGGRSVINNDGTNLNGATDTLTEKILKQYLTNVFGFALKETSPVAYEVNYVGTTDAAAANLNAWFEDDTDQDLYADIYTYSWTKTRDTVDNNVEETMVNTNGHTGKIAWKNAPTGGVDAINTAGTGTGVVQGVTRTDVEATPYYVDKKVDMMQDFRDKQINVGIDTDGDSTAEKALLKEYQEKKAAAVGLQDSDENLDPITITVHLANIYDATTNNNTNMWQYIPNATGANEYNFFYTGVLESGETSNLLIKSVEMNNTVTQDMFRDLQFDLNVAAESAQATYVDGLAMPTAANATLTGGRTTQDTGYAEGDKVLWQKDSANKSEITYEDPDGKAAADTDSVTHAAKISGANVTITKVAPVTISGGTYIYRIDLGAEGIYYGNSVEHGAVYTKVVDDAATDKVFEKSGDEFVTKKLD